MPNENWTDLHQDFAKNMSQQKWEEWGFTRAIAQPWITKGFAPSDHRDVIKWKNLGFTPEQARKWVSEGVKKNEAELAYYLQKENQQRINEELRKQYKQWWATLRAQQYLDYFYPLVRRAKIKHLDISKKSLLLEIPFIFKPEKLTGSLDLTGFINLEKLKCSHNQLTNLNLSECSKLQELACSSNKLYRLDLTSCRQLKKIDCQWNNFIALRSISNLTNLQELNCSNNTEFDLRLECLPESLKKIYCKGTKLAEKLEGYEKKPFFGSAYYDYQAWRKDYLGWKENFGEEKAEKWKEANLPLSELPYALYLKKEGLLTSTSFADSESLKEIYYQAQIWLDFHYPSEKRTTIIKLEIKELKLRGELNLSGFTKLTKLDCSHNQLTRLDLSNSLQLKELIVNDNQLTDIILPADGEQLVLERIDISNNEQLNPVKIERRFLKPLPVLTESEIKTIDSQELEQIIRTRSNISGTIKSIESCQTWWNPNCALVTNKVAWRAIHLIVYEPLTNKQETEISRLRSEMGIKQQKLEELSGEKTRSEHNEKQVKDEIQELEVQLTAISSEKEVLKSFKLTGELEVLTKSSAQTKVSQLKTQLNSDHPILVLYPHQTGFAPSAIFQITKLPEQAQKTPDLYLRSTDLIWRDMKGLPGAYHVAVYLGNNRVAHIGSSKFIKASKIKDNKKLLGARNDHWQDFLHGSANSLFRYRLIVPFKRPEQIEQHLTTAILAEYGAETYSLLGNNCEHFATLCVTGMLFSTQADKISLLANRVYLDLAKEIQNSEQAFRAMVNSEIFIREERRLEINQTLTELRRKTELTETERFKLTELISENQQIQLSLENQTDWEEVVKKHEQQIPGTIVRVIPLADYPNHVLVINKIVIYAVRLFKYDDGKLTELQRFAKSKVGYPTLETALDKVQRLLTNKDNSIESLQTISQFTSSSVDLTSISETEQLLVQLEIPPK